MRILVSGILVAIGLLMAQPAQADETKSGSIGTGIDVWNAQCKSPKTHCMFAYICDESTGLATWEMTMTVVSPTLLYGAGDVSNAHLGCNTGGVLLCRPGTTAGPMKAIITVTRPFVCPACPPTASYNYELNFGCFDKNQAVLPDVSDALTRTTHIVNQ